MKIDKWQDLSNLFLPIDFCVRINGEPDRLFCETIRKKLMKPRGKTYARCRLNIAKYVEGGLEHPPLPPGLIRVNPKRAGGGRNLPPPSTFRAIISWNFFPAPQAFINFFLWSLAQLLALFSKKSGLRFQSYATLCNRASAQNLKIFWICVQNMENGFLCQNSILSSKMQYLLSLQLKSLLYLLIFNTQTIPYGHFHNQWYTKGDKVVKI